ncbi:unnamed protein product [Adineta steineri]|uniref:ZZ-type domain-containing protein n=1 Tax=Adineta steineri TaxID=433720 RepID=A0A814C369_9BILA|nr:unnamed protein product [Adineta steineri]CAF0934627.1 unnamed protein product [Adineta steineri]
MATKCTSCGEQITSLSIMYKCRQCVDHFVCQLCEEKEHNRAGQLFHTLDEMSVSAAKSMANSATASSKNCNDKQESNKCTSSNSSIFTSDEYLYSFLTYCKHCHRVFSIEKETGFECQECKAYNVCNQCFPLMKTLHSSGHTFKILSENLPALTLNGLYHFGVTCNGCSSECFTGKRYQCRECSPSYDLCEKCFDKKHTHHEFRYIQHFMLFAHNRQILAVRTMSLAAKNGDLDRRDSITGWTVSDAERIIPQVTGMLQSYKSEFQEEVSKLIRDLRGAQQELDPVEDLKRRHWWACW